MEQMTNLIQGLQRGDTWAYERLVREYGDRMYRFVRRMVGVRLADDLVQEVFVRIYRSIGSYEQGGSFDSWVFTIASNLCVDSLRRRREERSHDALHEISAAPSADPLQSRELQDAFMHAVAQLPAEQKQVFLLREEAGIPFKEIARITGVPLNTALGRMHYAMEHLRNSLKAYNE